LNILLKKFKGILNGIQPKFDYSSGKDVWENSRLSFQGNNSE
jgi:hypothetical protein